MIYIIICLVLVIAYLCYLIYRKQLQIDSHNETILLYETEIVKMKKAALNAYINMRLVDIGGAFEGDDNVGIVFRTMCDIVTDFGADVMPDIQEVLYGKKDSDIK